MKPSGRKSRRRARRLRLLGLAVAALALIFVAVVLLRPDKDDGQRGDYRLRYQYDTIIEADGIQYRLRKDVTAILMMGIDRDSDMIDEMSARNGGQADFLRVVVLDAGRDTVSQIAIDRDTMTPITILGVTGGKLGYADYQICLAHGFGDGREESCGYTVEAVSKLLLDTPINFYIALNMDGISVLNDQAGGVTVTLEDDFTEVNPVWVSGAEITLHGDDAERFVRARMEIGDGTNESRMRRQQQYIARLTAILHQRISADKNFVGGLYDALEDYLTTNVSRGRLINETWNARGYARPEVYRIEGEHTIGKNGYMEFHADEDSIRGIVLELFYEPLS